MMKMLRQFFGGISGQVVVWSAAIAAALAVLIGARRSGRNAERSDQLQDELEKSEESNEIKDEQLDAAARRPRDRDELADRMRDGSF